MAVDGGKILTAWSRIKGYLGALNHSHAYDVDRRPCHVLAELLNLLYAMYTLLVLAA
jgi:hypothetical protein